MKPIAGLFAAVVQFGLTYGAASVLQDAGLIGPYPEFVTPFTIALFGAVLMIVACMLLQFDEKGVYIGRRRSGATAAQAPADQDGDRKPLKLTAVIAKVGDVPVFVANVPPNELGELPLEGEDKSQLPPGWPRGIIVLRWAGEY